MASTAPSTNYYGQPRPLIQSIYLTPHTVNESVTNNIIFSLNPFTNLDHNSQHNVTKDETSK